MAFVTPVVEHWLEREIAQWVHSMKDRSDDSSHHVLGQIPIPTSYINICIFCFKKGYHQNNGYHHLYENNDLPVTVLDETDGTQFVVQLMFT